MNRDNLFAPKNIRKTALSNFKLNFKIKPFHLIICASIILVTGVFFAFVKNNKSVIMVDGKSVVCVSSAGEAKNVIETIKSKSAQDTSQVNFQQNIRVASAPRTAHTVSRHMAVSRLERYVSPVIAKLAIIADGKPVVAVADKKTAGKVLELAKLRYGSKAKNLMEEPQIKESISIDTAAVSPELYKKTPEQALNYIFSPAAKAQKTQGIYVVKKGDVATSIAKRHHLKTRDLWNLNPNINLNRLSIGDKIKINKIQKNKPRLTVIVRDLIQRTEHFKAAPQKVSSASLYVGKSVLLDPGSTGLRDVKISVIYENGSKVGTELVEENVIREAIPRQVAVGIKPRPNW